MPRRRLSHTGLPRAASLATATSAPPARCRHHSHVRRDAMLYWTLIFLVVAIVAGVLGFGGIASTASGIAKVLFVVFLVLFVISLVMGRGTIA
jgi:uncharacterized membrane protein YtjA (UPF0391 family)